ncbi:Aryl-phospho-beta-D-glucosidase BglC, GH1 family [Paenibacillus sp. yr247]|uniref:discoidin domain-containing protein n=1 Tax=Paenibacillus sp. yr247 TaxID=1761880 RepID=UPI0008862963|nr:discoidin domain-containing protein [Paenibacillus sp. yr247]SDP28954.1 Aryl-phospho-beta-D-glucosidase BglC, GH1 family [Paenibacillus sp. yr247]
MKKKRIWSIVLTAAFVLESIVAIPKTQVAHAAALGASDFLKADGKFLKNNSGTGSIVTLRGTNLGGWMSQENWMSPLGEFALDRTGWTATASNSSSTAGNALDGDNATSWTTGTAQVNGQWFQVNMGAPQSFNRIYINAASSTNDDPTGYQILVSNDGANWTTVASGSGTPGNTIVKFASQAAQYIKVVQTGSSSSWWSISEFNVFTDSVLDRTGWTATASSSDPYGDVPANALDGNTGTHWGSGAAQVGGEWFKVDMGSNHTFNQIVLDSGSSSPSDYPRSYTVQVSNDGASWSQVASGQGFNEQLPINFPAVSARYIKITQTGSSGGNWWSIAEFNVNLNNDDYSMYEMLVKRFGTASADSLLDTFQNGWISTIDLDNIQNMGMNFIRIPISWHELMNDDGTWKLNAWTQLDAIVSGASSRGIYSLIDLHTVPGGDCPWGSCGRQGPNPNAFWTVTSNQDMVNTIWQGIAAHYKGNPAVAGYDLLNEPLLSFNEGSAEIATKNALYNRLYNTIRAVDPDHAIFFEAFFGFDKVAAPSTYGWTNVAYEIHPYAMSAPKDWDAQNNLVTNNLNTLSQYQQSWNVPVYAGEYSLFFFDDVWSRWMSGLSALHVAWTNWTYKVTGTGDGANWGFYNTNANPVPILNSDNFSTISSKWSLFDTGHFQANTDLINTVSNFTGGQTWIATTPLDETGWTATASSTGPGDSPGNALDWNSTTRWSTGAAQTSGQWFQVNMGAMKVVDQISIETKSTDTSDYPSGYQVQVSRDGTSWTTVASGNGFGHKMVIPFAPQYAQYIKIVQTGSNPTNWWSIAEFHAYSEIALDRSGWSVTASSTDPYGDVPGNAIDGNAGTRWSSGVPQAIGQWYQADMGRNQTINRVLLDAGASTSDYPRGYQVQVSTDGTTWTTVASGTGSGASVLVQFPVQVARYLKIVQTGSSSSWWSIAEMKVYGENEQSRTGWTATASSTESGGSPANALDNITGTRWSTGAPQTNGQWFNVNLGSLLWFNHIVMDSGTSTNDYARGYIVQVSNDNVNWTTVAVGEGTGPVVTVNFPITQAQYIKVTQTKSSASWWSIADFRAYQ